MVARLLTLPSGPVDALGRFFTLPLVIINTVDDAPVVDTETYVNATVTVSRTRTPYSGTTQIRGRGNSTWGLPKKPYRLKLGVAASLLGMPADRDWVLLANHYDPILARTSTALEMGRRVHGLIWTPRMRNVELVFNGEYLGVYQLGEHVKIGSSRIAINKAGTSGAALTGGYSLEIDQRGVVDWGDPGFVTAHDGIAVAYDDPDGSTPEHAAYIEDWVNSFEAALYGSNWLDPVHGYARFIDRNSFIDWYLIQELTASADSDFYSSCKLFKVRDSDGGRLHMGPLWDFDLSLGTGWDTGDDPTLWQRPTSGYFTRTSNAELRQYGNKGATWIKRMFDDPVFASVAWDRWQYFVLSLTQGPDPITGYIDRHMLMLRDASSRNRERWGITIEPNAHAAQMKVWLSARIAWLNDALVP